MLSNLQNDGFQIFRAICNLLVMLEGRLFCQVLSHGWKKSSHGCFLVMEDPKETAFVVQTQLKHLAETSAGMSLQPSSAALLTTLPSEFSPRALTWSSLALAQLSYR